ncbi:MAG: AsmA-like C-terminal region-containing protein [Candidatus Scalindua sp.]|nr:AsmA-like C-terminal region-containing protein [Candidatus Scalindua sp.]
MQEESKETGIVKTRKRKWPMIVGISIGGVICILAILVSLIPTIVSSNMVKNKIIINLEASLNREVNIDDINMSWSSGLDIKNIHIKDGNGLQGDTFVKVNRILCDIDFLPLIRKQIRINDLIIDSPEIVLQKGREGVLSDENISKPVKPTPTPAPEIVEKPAPEISRKPVEKPKYTLLVIPAFLFDTKIKAEISNGKFTFIDRQLQEKTIIRDLNTTLNADSLIKPIEFHSSFDLETKGEIEHADISLNVSLVKEGKINPESARGTLNMRTGFAQIAADFDMAKFMGEGGTGLDFFMNVDLEKLSNKLGGMLGMPEGMQIEGVISSKIKADGQLEKVIGIDGNTEITNLNIVGGPLGDNPIRQPSVKLIQNADIDIPNDKITVHKVSIKTNFTDLFLAGLVTDIKNARDLDLKIFLNLDITKLMSEVGGLLPENIEVAGRAQSYIKLKGRQSRLEVEGTTDLKNLSAKMGTVGPIKEPEIQVLHDVIYNLQNSNLEINNLSVKTSFAEIKSTGTFNKDREIDLNLLLSSDVEKLTQNLQSIIALPQGLNVSGKIAADILASGSAENELKLSGTTILHGINATGGPLKNNRISNLDLKLLHTLDYKIKEDSVYIKQMDISSDFLEMKSKGGIADLSKEKNIDYVLSLNMDLDKTTTQFAGMFPSEINMTGNGIVDLGINGKISAKENENLYEQMDIHGSISMDKIKYDTYEIKDFKTKLLLDDGFFTTKDFAFILNEGPGTVSASANLKEEKPSLVIGMSLSDMLINQNMDLLAYIVPVLAAPDGKISGKLSMTFDAKGNGLNWQDDLSKSLNGQGEFDIKDGHIKGGKITSKILKTFGKGGEYEFDNISTKFVIKESKIFNDDISINGKDFNIGLSGWTSFDGRLEYSADAKVMGDLIGGDFKRILGGMSKGSKLPIVVTGTVNNPKLAFKWPKPQEIGNILQGILGSSKDSKQQTESTGEPTQAETAEPEKEAQPKEKIGKMVEKLFKDFFK